MAGKGDEAHSSSGPIQLIPPGLLGLLQLKNRGANPSQLLDEYRPVIEMREWLLQQDARQFKLAQIALASGQGSALFSPTALRVPQGEAWWVHSYTIQAVLAAGDTVVLIVPEWNPQSTGTLDFNALPGGIIEPAGVAGPNSRISVAAHGFFLPPGSQLGFSYVVGSGTTITFNGFVRYTSLPL